MIRAFDKRGTLLRLLTTNGVNVVVANYGVKWQVLVNRRRNCYDGFSPRSTE